jgi:predicted ribosomally synthesized peptide with nif11-like leader
MSVEAVIQFIEDLTRDDSLRKTLASTMDGAEDPVAALMEFAAERGHTFSEEELRAALDRVAMTGSELPDEALESVAGGKGGNPAGSMGSAPAGGMTEQQQPMQSAARDRQTQSNVAKAIRNRTRG